MTGNLGGRWGPPGAMDASEDGYVGHVGDAGTSRSDAGGLSVSKLRPSGAGGKGSGGGGVGCIYGAHTVLNLLEYMAHIVHTYTMPD